MCFLQTEVKVTLELYAKSDVVAQHIRLKRQSLSIGIPVIGKLIYFCLESKILIEKSSSLDNSLRTFLYELMTQR